MIVLRKKKNTMQKSLLWYLILWLTIQEKVRQLILIVLVVMTQSVLISMYIIIYIILPMYILTKN